jgi:hypothetical protein
MLSIDAREIVKICLPERDESLFDTFFGGLIGLVFTLDEDGAVDPATGRLRAFRIEQRSSGQFPLARAAIHTVMGALSDEASLELDTRVPKT